MITENNNKYLMPPSAELINKVVEKFNVSEFQFERFFGLPKRMIYLVTSGERRMPSKYWHLFYDPQYDNVLRTTRKKEPYTKPYTGMVAKLGTKNNPVTSIKSKSESKPDPKLKGLLTK